MDTSSQPATIIMSALSGEPLRNWHTVNAHTLIKHLLFVKPEMGHGGLGPGGDGSLSHCHDRLQSSMSELTSETGQLMPIIIAESAKAGPFVKHLLVFKHPVSCCWSYKHRCLTTSITVYQTGLQYIRHLGFLVYILTT